MIRHPLFLSTKSLKLVNQARQLAAKLKPAGLCVNCLAPADHRNGLCLGCYGDLPRNDEACHRCGLPLLFAVRRASGGPMTCGQCLKHPPPFLRTMAFWRYQFPVDRMISRFKYGGNQVFARPLLTEFASSLQQQLADRLLEQPDLLVPVPLHAARRRQRGFNQAEDIAEAISLHTGIPWSASHLRKTRATLTQGTLDRRQRLRNLRGAFEVTARLPAHVALVDDVMTTGATMNTLASLLRQQGVEKVQVWVLARTPG